MKKTFTVLTIAVATIFLTACGDEKAADTKISKGTSQVLEVLEQQIAKAEGTVTQAPERKSGVNADAPTPAPGKLPAEAYNGGEGIDLDLTALSSTVVYAEVYNMMVDPDAYVGDKTAVKSEYPWGSGRSGAIPAVFCVLKGTSRRLPRRRR